MSWINENFVTEKQLKTIAQSIADKSKLVFVSNSSINELESKVTELESVIENLTARIEALEQPTNIDNNDEIPEEGE